MTRKPLAVIAMTAVLASGAALAAIQSDAGALLPATPKARPLLDRNGDGFIDRSEAAAHPRLAARFDSLDASRDGKLDKAELQHMRATWRGKAGRMHGHGGGMLPKLDTDQDGRISRAEAAARPGFAARFDVLDVNQDGFADHADVQARRTQRRNDGFDQADTDRNGQLSRAEFAKAGDACRAQRAAAWPGMPAQAAKPAK